MKKFNNQKGQAFFEMIIFLPFLIFLYTIFYTVGNSINGSINQQKSVRGYFYQLVKGNAYVNTVVDLEGLNSMKIVGFFAIGWNEKLEGKTPIAPCFAFSSILKNNSNETCDSPTRPTPNASTFVRIFTMYGICGAVFTPLTSGIAVPTSGRSFVLDQTNQMGACKLGN